MTLRDTLPVWDGSTESIAVDIHTHADPTDTAPQFAVGPDGAAPTTGWVAGTWDPDAVWQRGRWLRCWSPVIGVDLTPTRGRSVLWVRPTIGTQQPIRAVAVLEIR